MELIHSLANSQLPHDRSALSKALWAVESIVVRWLLKPPHKDAPRKLHLGCGRRLVKGWLNSDFATLRWIAVQRQSLPDWNLDATQNWRCDDNYFDAIHCEHVIEHFTYPVAIRVLKECLRTLRGDGRLRVIVPDLRRYVEYYQGREVSSDFLALGPGVAAISKLTQCHGHLSVWDAGTLIKVLEELGFDEVVERRFMQTHMSGTCIDSPERAWESVYVEAAKSHRLCS